MRVMPRRLGRFAEDRILWKHREWLLLGLCVRRRGRHHAWPSWMFARHMTGARGCDVR